ncbi:mechanosensitive ion channel family protein [Paludibacterium yongneupense]|uniref:mechanosensitive ion channel family protein n=1 Tax=Paludibacterium yongneupense TaxID=400061 RepID=UPI000403E431|nr:mechanosensitive ion channel family protein [Paludibacterium yongneupense]
MNDLLSLALTKLESGLLERGFAIGSDLLLAVLFLWVGWKLAHRIERALEKMMNLSGRVDATLRPLLLSLAAWSLKILALAMALAQIGVQMATIAAVLGAAGLAVGLALQGTLQNIAAGIMLVLLRPFKVGDYVECSGTLSGTIREIGLFSTLIERFDGIHLFVPNNQIWGSTIANFSRNPTRRLDLPLRLAPDSDTMHALAILRGYVDTLEPVRHDPAPQVFVSELGSNGPEFTLRLWSDTADYWDLRWRIAAELPQLLLDAHLELARPLWPEIPATAR